MTRPFYRQSPRPLERVLSEPGRRGLSPDDLPLGFSGEGLVQLDPRGRLMSFRVIPPEVDRVGGPPAPVEWSPLFAAAGLSLDQVVWKPAEPERNPAFYPDQRVAWTGSIARLPVRRRRPHLLVTWTRLLAGEWRDPLVGRDVLIGCAAGLAMVLANRIPALAPAFGYPQPAESGVPVASGLASVIWRLCDSASGEAVFASLGFLFLFVALEVLVRKPWLAQLVIVVVLASTSFASSTVLIVLPEAALSIGIRLMVLTRVGLLAGMVNGFVFLIFVNNPITFDTSAWYAPAGLVYLAVVAAITLFGFRTSLGGRPLLQLRGFEG